MPRTDLTAADLQPGDLVIWRMGDSDANHVEMFTGASHFAATSIHAVNSSAKNMTRVMATSFTAGSHKQIYRLTNRPRQVAKALKFAQQWARFENKYDTPRINVKTSFRNMHRALHTSNLQMLQLMRNLFEERGKFRAIKYAVRRRGPLCYPGEDGNSGHGMTCCMFAITCYQAAGIAGEVNKLDPGNPYVRNSDKKMTRGDLAVLQKMMAKDGFAPVDFEAYRRYVEMIQDVNEYRIDWAAAGGNEVVKAAPAKKWVGYTYIPSIMFWKRPAVFSTFDWAAALTPGMMLDAKIANPEHIRQSLEADAGNWEYIGSMKSETTMPTDSQKLIYQQALQQNQQAAGQLRQGFARSLPPTHRPGHH